MRRAGRGRRLSMSLGMSSSVAGGVGTGEHEGGSGGGGGGGGGGDGGGVDEERRGAVVGAEGAFPVAIEFTGEAEGEWFEGGGTELNESVEARKVYRDQAGFPGTGEQRRKSIASGGTCGGASKAEGIGRAEANTRSPTGKRREDGGRGEGGGGEEVASLESWAADFGLCVGDDSERAERAGRRGGVVMDDTLAGWGLSPDEVTGMPGSGEEEAAGRTREETDSGHAVVGADEMRVTRTEAVEDVVGEGQSDPEDVAMRGKNGRVSRDATRHDVNVTKEVPERSGFRSRVASLVEGSTGTTERGGEDVEPAGMAGRVGKASRGASFGFLDGLRQLGKGRGDRELEKLEVAVRTTGGELQALTDRLSDLSASVRRHPVIAAGRGAARVAAATEDVASLRSMLRAVADREYLRRPAEIRSAAKAAERRVRDAETAIEEDIALLVDEESRRAAALAEASACRDDLDAIRARLRVAGSIMDASAAAELSRALGEAQASVEACVDRLGQAIQTVPRRRGGRSGLAAADELSVARCRAKMGALVAVVNEACAKRPQQQSPGRGKTQGHPPRKRGEQLLVQARTLGRAMLGQEDMERETRGGSRDGGNRFQEALDKLDAALAEADRCRADAPPEGKGDSDLFKKVAPEASRAAVELQSAGGASGEQVRALVGISLAELCEAEDDVRAFGMDGDRSVMEAMRVARRGLERMSRALGEGGGAGSRRVGGRHIENLVASGSLESALRGLDEARAAVSRVRRVSTMEAEARGVLVKEGARVDGLSRKAHELGLLQRPALARVVQACREAVTAAERFDSRGERVLSGKREALAREYMAAALLVCEATGRAEETLALERDAAAYNADARLEEHLEPSRATLSRLQGRLDLLATAAEQRRTSLEGVRVLAASWKEGVAGEGPRGPLPAEPCGETAVRATTEARECLSALLREAQTSRDVTTLNEDVNLSLHRVAVAKEEVAKAEVRRRRRDNAFAALERAAAKTDSVIADARAAKVAGRVAVAEALAAAACSVRGGLIAVVDTIGASGLGELEADDPLLTVAGRAEEVAEGAAEVLARERLLVEQAERERQQRSSELWSAARRLEEIDTSGVVGDEPEAAAMILEARSEAVQVLAALEAADDPSTHLGAAQTVLENAAVAEECFAEAQRRVRCFDEAASLLEQAEVRVDEAETVMKAGSAPAASRAAFEDALGRYENVLSTTVASTDGADSFLEACNAAFAAAREVERAAARARRRVRARAERRRRELSRLDRPAAALVALDLSELTEARGDVSSRAVAEGIRDALSAISAARKAVAEGPQEHEEEEEAALAGRVDSVVHAAAAAERAFREARERARLAERWRQELARPEAALMRVREEMTALADTELISELCSVSLEGAERSLVGVREVVAAIGKGEKGVADVEATMEEARAKVRTAQRDAEEQATRVKTATSQRQMLRAALVASADSLAQAQAGLDADEELRSCEAEANKGDAMSEALRACAVGERAATVALERLDTPLNSEWFRLVSDDAGGGGRAFGAEEDERVVDAAQRAATEAEVAVAHLIERLGQIRGIRAKLRSMLTNSEARFRRACAAIADAGSAHNNTEVDEAMHVAGTALASARIRLRSSLGTGYFVPGGNGVGYGGGLARDEEAVSEARGFVTALEMMAASAGEAVSRETVKTPQADRQAIGEGSPSSTAPGTAASDVDMNYLQSAAGDALALAMQWGDALRAQVSERQLGGDPSVMQVMKAAESAMREAHKLWSLGTRTRDCGSDEAGRNAVEGLAAELGMLEKVIEDVAEKRRERGAGLGAAARRLDRLLATLTYLEETVKLAGEPLVSLTAEAMRAASDATRAAAAGAAAFGISLREEGAAAAAGDGIRRRLLSRSPSDEAFVDSVQAAAVAVAQAEATVTRARERASQVSAERVRALETLVGFAEMLSEAGERLASSSAERGLSSSREAAAAISEAQAALGRARAAAQVDARAWVSGAAAIAEAVTKAGELVRSAKRSADGPAVVRPTTTGTKGPAGGATNEAVAEAEANARAWLEQKEEAEAKDASEAAVQRRKEAHSADGRGAGRSTPMATTNVRKTRIGFSKNGEAAQTYLPLWMRLQKKAWDAGRMESDGAGGVDDVRENAVASETAERLPAFSAPPPTSTSGASTSGVSTAASRRQASVPSGTRENGAPARAEEAGTNRRRQEEERLRAEAHRLRAEVARLRLARGAGNRGNVGGRGGVSGSGKERVASTGKPRDFKETAEALAEELVKDFAARAKKEAQRRTSRRSRVSGDESPPSPPDA